MERFDFRKIVQQYGDKIALVVDEKKYSFNTLYEKATQLINNKQFQRPYVVLVAENSLSFVVSFLAVNIAGCVPIVISHYDIDNIEDMLYSLSDMWQWLDDTTHNDVAGNSNVNSELLFLGTTSGTTGVAKVYQRNWQSWQLGFEICQETFRIENYAGIMTTSPLHTSLGLHTLLLSLYLGKTFVCFKKKSQNNLIAGILVFTVPTYMAVNYRQWAVNYSVSGVISCGGELTTQLANEWRRRYPNQQLYELYGSSETSLVAWQNLGSGKLTSCVGELFPHVQVKFVSDYIVVSSPYLFSGYLGSKHINKCVRTDDVGVYQNERLFILGRKSDVINHGGNKIYPSEIETVLSQYADDVVVFGVPDDVYEEKIVAMLVTQHKLSVIQNFVVAKLPRYKRPVDYVFVSEIPKTAQHKISRSQLSEQYIKGTWG